VHRICEEFT